MNFDVFSGFIYLIILFLIFLSIFDALFLPSVKGNSGEWTVSRILKSLPEDSYIVLNDIMVPTENGTSQIDHVVVSIYGIFVIETKNYKGWIFGSERSRNWTQVIYQKKTRFHNPLLQNYGHVKALEYLLGLPEEYFHSIVVFTQRARFKSDAGDRVVYTSDLRDHIMSYIVPAMSAERMKETADDIRSLNIEDPHVRREHIQNIRRMQAAAHMEADAGICPQCGGRLVLRHGRYDDFYGCSNYPLCHYTKKI